MQHFTLHKHNSQLKTLGEVPILILPLLYLNIGLLSYNHVELWLVSEGLDFHLQTIQEVMEILRIGGYTRNATF